MIWFNMGDKSSGLCYPQPGASGCAPLRDNQSSLAAWFPNL